MRGNNQERVNGRFPPCDVPPQEAFEVLQSLPVGKRTLKAHAEAMAKIGKPVSVATLRKWRVRHDWDGRLDLTGSKHAIPTTNSLVMLEAAAEKMTPKVLIGLQAMLIHRLYLSIMQLPSTLQDADAILSLMNKVHELRMAGNQPALGGDDHELPDFSIRSN